VHYLPSENGGLKTQLEVSVQTADTPMFVVFDGMGGEKHGEIAAFLAAKTFDETRAKSKSCRNSDIAAFLSETCKKMNAAVCEYSANNNTGSMGTTAAILAFDKQQVYICNIGDSRIFRFGGGALTKLSFDHVTPPRGSLKPSLTQCLGIPESEFVIEPFITTSEYKKRDKFLICSDGLTDMVSPDSIAAILSNKLNIRKCAESLMSTALSNGGRDNITVILCEIRRGWRNKGV
jgi:protein phosphatase